MQGDGNLVESRTSDGYAVWASNTPGRGADHLAMQTDANLVLCTPANTPVWATNTAHWVPNVTLVLVNNGTLALVGVTGTFSLHTA